MKPERPEIDMTQMLLLISLFLGVGRYLQKPHIAMKIKKKITERSEKNKGNQVLLCRRNSKFSERDST